MTFNYALSDLLLPPTSLAIGALLGVVLLRRYRRFGLALIVGSQLMLAVLSLPAVASFLVGLLEPPPVSLQSLRNAQAIVILGGGRNLGAPEWGGETVSTHTLQRLRYGAHLARESGLPVYVTGGKPDGGERAEATLMRDVLVSEFLVKVRWLDVDANTTGENARAAVRDLKPVGIRDVALVTDAIHMPRAQRAFERAGFRVIACPTGYTAQRPFANSQLVPGVGALYLSQMALREMIAQAYYWLSELPA